MSELRGELLPALVTGLLVLGGCDEPRSEARAGEPQIPSLDSSVILDAMRSVQVGGELVELNWTTLGDVSAELGGTSFESEDLEPIYAADARHSAHTAQIPAPLSIVGMLPCSQ